MAEYKVNLVQSEEIPAHDSLVAKGDTVAVALTLAAKGEFKRGTLLMASGDNFIPATAEGASSAELAILSEDIEITEDDATATIAGYVRGTFSGNVIILPYETEESDHEELLSAIQAPMRKQGIFVV